MHKGDYHTDYSKYYDKEYKDKDLAFEHIKKLKQEKRHTGVMDDAAELDTVIIRKRYCKKSEK